ncbi:ATP-binding protein [Tropicibacter oceani]|uniref:ATP-binding protein n=1 Tax=Tropicibacter oceani TaxID=3058420 RepID=A0ABY8QH84_9RHOB|nr:ATP-binding protein [Tropicibacter oceani]WGW04012.1 ATP-binding protein [Tropicibacter oceani]
MTPTDRQNGVRMHYVLASRPEAVRETLAAARDDLARHGHGHEALGPCELVLAEALNNIVEHAYEERVDGEISLCLTLVGDRLDAQIEDRGHSMPGGDLPKGELTTLDVSNADLPEGGFGWFLIRSMTDDLRYRRKEGVNYLSFSIMLGTH